MVKHIRARSKDRNEAKQTRPPRTVSHEEDTWTCEPVLDQKIQEETDAWPRRCNHMYDVHNSVHVQVLQEPVWVNPLKFNLHHIEYLDTNSEY